jgi:chromosome transmission fidelity protein 18
MNVLRVSYIDPTFDKCAAAHEWLSSADIFRSRKTSVASNNTAAQHAMEALHIPSAAAAIHLLCRVEQRPDLTYSTRELADARYQQEANHVLTQKFVEGLAPQARGSSCVNLLVTETIPYSLWILSAGEGSSALDRAASSLGILSKREKSAVDMHISTLRALGLTYVSQEDSYSDKEATHTATLRLEPPIDRLCHFVDLSLSKGETRRDIPPPVSLSESFPHAEVDVFLTF